MIGHFLQHLHVKQEDALLTKAFHPGLAIHPDGTPCLMGLAWSIEQRTPRAQWRDNIATYMAPKYDKLCNRFGETRINTAIRQRILTNRLWRTLASAKQQVEEAVGVRV